MNIINDLFYNTVPGVIFLLTWIFIFDKDLSSLKHPINNEFIVGLIFSAASLLVGFFLQAVWRIFRRGFDDNLLLKDEEIADEVLNLNPEETAKEKLDAVNMVLWLTEKQPLSDYFSARSALFSNVIVGCIITFLSGWISCWLSKITIITALWISLGTLITYFNAVFFYRNYRKAQYGTINRTTKLLKSKELKSLYALLKR